MQLNVRETADLLGVSEKKIQSWVRHSGLPFARIKDQYSFNRIEVLEWATSQGISLRAEAFLETPRDAVPMPGLGESLSAGGIHYGVGGTDKGSVLKSVVGLMPLTDDVDRSFLLRVLLARESLGATGVGDGIAIPHVRNPIVMHIPRPMITLCFLEQPIEFGALDAKPVHTLFTLVSPTIPSHLHLLYKVAFGLRQPSFGGAIAGRAPAEEILAAAYLVDGKASSGASASGGESR